jgi:tetratricopeptide (TPR) repeat protein
VDAAQAMLIQGNFLSSARRYEEAIAFYDRAVEIKPDKYEAWSNRGNSLLTLGRYEEAIKSYNKSIDINPDCYEAWLGRGTALYNLGEYKKAVESYDQAVAIKSDIKERWCLRGIMLCSLGRYEEAVFSYNHVMTDFSDAPRSILYRKGAAYFKWGKYSEAIDCYDQAIAIQPDKYNFWHDKGLVQFVMNHYQSALATWQQAFRYISDPEVPRYYENISGLIQEFIEELISRFTQPTIQQTLLVPLLAIYQKANVIAVRVA